MPACDRRAPAQGRRASPVATHPETTPAAESITFLEMTTQSAPAGERILVVDDEPDITALVAYHLARTGYRVSTAATGTDALKAIRSERPALAVPDLMLPGLSGYEVIEQVRQDASTSELPVLMLTARKEEADRVRGFTLGADDYLTKPFSPQELVLRVGAILRRSRAAPASADVLSAGLLRIERDTHREARRG